MLDAYDLGVRSRPTAVVTTTLTGERELQLGTTAGLDVAANFDEVRHNNLKARAG